MAIELAASINNLGVTRRRDSRADDIDARGDQSEEKEQSRLMAQEPRSLIVNELGTPFECHICGRSFGSGESFAVILADLAAVCIRYRISQG